MAAVRIRVNTGSLQKTSSLCAAHLKEIRRDLSSLELEIAALNASWSGDAHDAFSTKTAVDLQRAQELCKKVEAIIQFETTAVKEYNAGEDRILDVIASLKN